MVTMVTMVTVVILMIIILQKCSSCGKTFATKFIPMNLLPFMYQLITSMLDINSLALQNVFSSPPQAQSCCTSVSFDQLLSP